ncbi:acetoin dehydrogenase dihydrolipoyllysine-residue acetyltransferase subunit [Brucella gallinifaecis]|uniref:Acetoin dehydrogenase dihydrolipoyllysine-residue acetyltransferase subunit n=1 Tax=Brucella gallinifaecis TaxID=215590 RepID=A0A502BKY0_9HYPH|nr:acetoin dehydrogenase dihydrolipoyllysine-residue acetyltransferase subunit [Brucella gallinifaecis]TPF74704.1 acetoin dehydrogenase dihydrolipoyllysine-residue acetyltransferase subunit [Brucella gallinifaecis]
MTDIVVTGAGGEYMEAVVVVEWLAKVGDAVKAGDVVVIVETAKAATEIEAPASGILTEIRAEIGTEIEIGGLLGIIGSSDDKPVTAAQTKTPAAISTQPVEVVEKPILKYRDRIIASPLARRLAAEKGIDLKTVNASSPSGRIKVRDIEKLLKQADAAATVTSQSAASELKPLIQSANGLHIQRRAGEGIPIVFLHGFGSDSLSWRSVLGALRSRNTTLSIDLPSHGRSPLLPVNDVRQLAGVIVTALENAGLEQVHLVGHSLGGATALAIAEAGSIDIRSLTLISPAGLGADINGAFIDGFARASRKESLEPWLRQLVADKALISPAFVAATMQQRENVDLRNAQADLAQRLFPDGTQASDFSDVLTRLTIPQRIIWGHQDQIIPWKHALGGPGKAGLHLLPNIGHMPQFEAAEQVANIIDEIVRTAS